MKITQAARRLAASALVLGLVGCAYSQFQNMNPAYYDQVANQRAFAKHCFDGGYWPAKLYADMETGVDSQLSVLNFDREKLHEKTVAQFKSIRVTESSCRDAEVVAYQVIARGELIQRNLAAGRGQTQSSTPMPQVRQPVWCNRIGTTTMCN